MALTRCLGATTTDPPRRPLNSLGSLPMVYPVMRVDAALQHHCWEILQLDLLVLDPSRLAPSDQMVGLVEALRTEQATVHQEQVEAHNQTSAPKEPLEAFPQTAVLWRRYCSVMMDAQLLSLYHMWANSTKAERRDALQAALDERASSGLGASWVIPLATKELCELLFQARLASHTHEAEDLTKGVSPFTCGYQVGERDQDVAVRAHRFDQMLLGHTNPTLAEQETLQTKDLPLPFTIYQFTMQLECFSTVMDVALGEIHPAAVTLRNFCLTDWPNLEHSLQGMPDDVRPYLPSMLLWFHKPISGGCCRVAHCRSLAWSSSRNSLSSECPGVTVDDYIHHSTPAITIASHHDNQRHRGGSGTSTRAGTYLTGRPGGATKHPP